MSSFDAQLLREKLELLDGARRKQQDKAAVRFEDLRPLLALNLKLQSKPIQQAPDAQAYNNLVKDVHTMHQCLQAIIAIIQKRLLP